MDDVGTQHKGPNQAGLRPQPQLVWEMGSGLGQGPGPDSLCGDSSAGQHYTELPWRATWRSWRSCWRAGPLWTFRIG